jgi:hypothetical protein
MRRWTKPRHIAYKSQWFDNSFDYTGPACYEIGTGGPRGGNIQWHYVGETNDETQKIRTYARNGSHLSKMINWHLRQGWHLYYRSRACATKKEAEQLQNNLLARYKYDWNNKLNKE